MRIVLVLLALIIVVAGCSNASENSIDSESKGKIEPQFKIYSATEGFTPVFSKFDLKGDLLVWLDDSTGWPAIIVKNLSTNQLWNITFPNNQINNPQISGGYIIFQRKQIPKLNDHDSSRIYSWNFNDGKVEQITCDIWQEPFADTIIAANDGLVYFEGKATHIINASTNATCNMYRKVLYNDTSGNVKEIEARYAAYDDDRILIQGVSRTNFGVIKDENPPPEMIDICLEDTGNDCQTCTEDLCNCRIVPCEKRKGLIFGKDVKLITRHNLLLFNRDTCLIYDYGNHPYIDSLNELKKAVKGQIVRCDYSNGKVGIAVNFDRNINDFKVVQFPLDDTPDLPQFRIPNFHKTRVVEENANKELLEEIHELFFNSYDVCLKDSYGDFSGYSCDSWERYTKVYSPHLDKTFSIYGGKYDCNERYGCHSGTGDFFFGQGDQTESGELDFLPETHIFHNNLQHLEINTKSPPTNKKILSSMRYIAAQQLGDPNIFILELKGD